MPEELNPAETIFPGTKLHRVFKWVSIRLKSGGCRVLQLPPFGWVDFDHSLAGSNCPPPPLYLRYTSVSLTEV